jgi:type IV pilus assembly protein PilO
MKVTKREQILIGALLIMLLGYSYYNYIYTKQIQNISELKGSRDEYSQKWEQGKANIASKDKRKEQYRTLNTKISKVTDMLFPSIEQEEIIVVLDKMIKESNLQAETLEFSEVSRENTAVDTSKTAKIEDKTKNTTNELDKVVNDFNGTTAKDATSEKTNTNNSNVNGAYKMQVTFKFNGSNDELMSFIEKVEDYDKKIIINSIYLLEAEGSDLSGTIILDFYGVPKLNNNYEFDWDYKAPSGIENPFAGSSTSLQVSNDIITNEAENTTAKEVITNEAENTTTKEVIKNDFIMTANPKTSDLHTVTIEKAKDESKQSYIYADNEGIELAELYFTKIENKYFYKYRTVIETYPENFNNYIEFVPNGENIILDIFSQNRGLASDLSGANIKITNDTDKSIVVNIIDDDKNRPRVKILEENGDISVNRNYNDNSGK